MVIIVFEDLIARKLLFQIHTPKTSPYPLQRGNCTSGKSPIEGGRGMSSVDMKKILKIEFNIKKPRAVTRGTILGIKNVFYYNFGNFIL
jgi:hypothetical protein